MKAKRFVGWLLAGMFLLTGCGAAASKEPTKETPKETTIETKEEPTVENPTIIPPSETPIVPDEPQNETKDLRVLLSSDIHCTDLLQWYGVDYRQRMQHWVDSVLKEHSENPIDLLIINGDISLDYWINGGSVIEKGKGTASIFIDEYLSQLPDDLPVYVLPGNHEQYSDEQWLALTGNARQGAMGVGGRLFIFLDNFGGNLDPDYHHDGVYTQSDVAYIEEMMAQYPACDVYLVAHYFDVDNESAAFKKLVSENDRIVALFAGHTHKTAVLSIGEKTVAQTGNFAYYKDSAKESFWGFRELVITDENAYSQYIIVESDASPDGVAKHFDRAIRNQVCYYGEAPELPEDPDPLAKYNTLYDKIDQSSVDGDAGAKESNRVQLIFDNKVDTKWCVKPTLADKSVSVTWEMNEAVKIDAYALSTANDHLTRNPKAWTLYARNDESEEWTVLSDVSGAELPQELYTVSQVFRVDNPGSYRYYKMIFTANCGNDYYQFSELILLQNK